MTSGVIFFEADKERFLRPSYSQRKDLSIANGSDKDKISKNLNNLQKSSSPSKDSRSFLLRWRRAKQNTEMMRKTVRIMSEAMMAITEPIFIR